MLLVLYRAFVSSGKMNENESNKHVEFILEILLLSFFSTRNSSINQVFPIEERLDEQRLPRI